MSKTTFNFTNITNFVRNPNFSSTEISVDEKIQNYCKIINDIFFIRKSIITRKSLRKYNIPLEKFIEKNNIITLQTQTLKRVQDHLIIVKERIINYNNIFNIDYIIEKNSKLHAEKILEDNYELDIYDTEITDMNLTNVDASWDIEFLLTLYPKFNFEASDITLDFINSLLLIHTESVRGANSKLNNYEKTANSTINWEILDNFYRDLINNINFKDSESNKIIITDKLYDLFVILTSGNIDHYKNINDLIIYLPMIKEKHWSNRRIISMAYKLFKENQVKYKETVRILIHNFIRDRQPVEIKINLPNRFTDGDDIITLTNKICNLTTIRSDNKNNNTASLLLIIEQLELLLDYALNNNIEVKNYEEELKKYNELDNEEPVEFRYLPNYQVTLLNSVIMYILSELKYSDRIKILLTTSNLVIKKYDQLINKVIRIIKSQYLKYGTDKSITTEERSKITKIIGLDNDDFIRMGRFLGIIGMLDFSDIMIKPDIHLSYLNTEAMERYKVNESFVKWMKENKLQIHPWCLNQWQRIIKKRD